MAEKIGSVQPLGNGLVVHVSDLHTFGTDTVVLADFARPKVTDRAIDLGSGCLTIPLLWCRENKPRAIVAVEVEQDACALSKRSIEDNGLADTIELLCRDLRDLKPVLPAESFDLACVNPPYKALGSGLLSEAPSRRIARHETQCTLEEICQAAFYLLRFGGRFCLCHRPERLTDVLETMRRAQIEPKRLRLVQQRRDKAPKLALIEGRKGGKSGFMTVMPTLLIEDQQGGWSPEMLDIYGSYKEGHR